MRIAVGLGLFFALLMGVAILPDIATVASAIQTELAAGLPHSFVGLWPFFLVLLLLAIGAAFVVSAGGNRRR